MCVKKWGARQIVLVGPSHLGFRHVKRLGAFLIEPPAFFFLTLELEGDAGEIPAGLGADHPARGLVDQVPPLGVELAGEEDSARQPRESARGVGRFCEGANGRIEYRNAAADHTHVATERPKFATRTKRSAVVETPAIAL